MRGRDWTVLPARCKAAGKQVCKGRLCATLLLPSRTEMKYLEANSNQVPLLGSMCPVDTSGLKINCRKEFSGALTFPLMWLMEILMKLLTKPEHSSSNGSLFRSYLLLPWIPATAFLILVLHYCLFTFAKVRLV